MNEFATVYSTATAAQVMSLVDDVSRYSDFEDYADEVPGYISLVEMWRGSEAELFRDAEALAQLLLRNGYAAAMSYDGDAIPQSLA